MALPPQKTQPDPADEAFLREVDEGVRRDQLQSLWQRFGKLAIVVLVLFLASVAGILWWQAETVRKAGVAGEELLQAVDKLSVGDTKSAQPALAQLEKDGPAGYRPLARMMQATEAVTAADNAKAIKQLDAVAADTSLAEPLRDAALIKSVRLGYDSMPPATVVARLKDLSLPGNPWFGIAGEMTALAHLKAGEPEKAKPLLTAIVRDVSLPNSLRGRTAQLALSLGVDAVTLQLPKSANDLQGAPAPAPAAK